ncbi:heterokaryon incompatibility protein-domain-containing protein [Xylariaceae sp. FL1651]|nr:heterokaryon incompatibility protein-domain-containing protein [Xylariaceae sp. FL1651]
MWLIDTYNLKLVLHTNLPSEGYAILSHTWQDEEVSFQDFQNVNYDRTRKVFSKITETCRLSRKANLRWAWVDTCCINKESSAELTEAINSMFRWYRNAAVCFVYLSDLPPGRTSSPISRETPAGIPEDGETIRRDLTQSGFRDCRWFTRGWTLQEMLAPAKLEFRDSSWDLRGTKRYLCSYLAEITGVDSAALNNSRPLRSYSIAARMCWVSRRETTRVEDMAYCLLGIFDIFMPMIYGEGPNAFIRLQEEICKSTDDMSLFAWNPMDHGTRTFRGIFAHSSREFCNSGSIIPFPPSRRREREFAITNRGVRFECLIQNYGSWVAQSILLLDCTDSATDDHALIGINFSASGHEAFRHIDPLIRIKHYCEMKSLKTTLYFPKVGSNFYGPEEYEDPIHNPGVVMFYPQSIRVLDTRPRVFMPNSSNGEIVWRVSDSHWLAYSLFEVSGRPFPELGIRPFRCVVALAVYLEDDDTEEDVMSYVWTPQSPLWTTVIDIVDHPNAQASGSSNYCLRQLLQPAIESGEETPVAAYREEGKRVVIELKNTDEGEFTLSVEAFDNEDENNQDFR